MSNEFYKNCYRKRECSCCGKFTFEKFIGNSVDQFELSHNFKSSGFGTMVVNYYDLIESVTTSRIEIRLCPDCAAEIDKALYDKIDELTGDRKNE